MSDHKFIRCTKDGSVVLRFDSDDPVPEGFVDVVNGERPRIHAEILQNVVLVIDGQAVKCPNVSVEKAVVTVWGFETESDRDEHNMDHAILIGAASTYQDLVDLAACESNCFFDYQNPDTFRWVGHNGALELIKRAAPVYPMTRCANCSRLIRMENSFCPYCGVENKNKQ